MRELDLLALALLQRELRSKRGRQALINLFQLLTEEVLSVIQIVRNDPAVCVRDKHRAIENYDLNKRGEAELAGFQDDVPAHARQCLS